MTEEKQEKKIIIDEDWKQQAQKEKESLAEEEKKPEQEQQPERGPLPEGNFAALISMLVTQSLFALGVIKIKGQEDKKPDLQLAKYNIDMLESLEEKTKGNLSEDEQKVLTDMLSQVRMAYVQVAG